MNNKEFVEEYVKQLSNIVQDRDINIYPGKVNPNLTKLRYFTLENIEFNPGQCIKLLYNEAIDNNLDKLNSYCIIRSHYGSNNLEENWKQFKVELIRVSLLAQDTEYNDQWGNHNKYITIRTLVKEGFKKDK